MVVMTGAWAGRRLYIALCLYFDVAQRTSQASFVYFRTISAVSSSGKLKEGELGWLTFAVASACL
jgi:hypothetical protein